MLSRIVPIESKWRVEKLCAPQWLIIGDYTDYNDATIAQNSITSKHEVAPMTHPHSPTADMSKTQLVPIGNALGNALYAIGTAYSYEDAAEALEQAEALQSVAFTPEQEIVAAQVIESATRRVERYMA